MLRNLMSRNGLPCRPGRTWMNNTGRPSFKAIRHAHMNITGKRMMIRSSAAITSTIRFTVRYLMGLYDFSTKQL